MINKSCTGTGLYCALFWIQGKTVTSLLRQTTALYCALFWIQGKTVSSAREGEEGLYCALFWIQGKTAVFTYVKSVKLYCALFWIQGKTFSNRKQVVKYCTVPYFGFKAKRKSLRCSSSSLVISIAPMWLRSFL